MNQEQFANGKKVLVTTDNWFFAPDGRQYKAAWGTVRGVETDDRTLGIRTNARSTNWYLQLGCLVIAGCQIHYAVACDTCNTGAVKDFKESEGTVVRFDRPTYVFNADEVSA